MPRRRDRVEIARTGTFELSSGTHTFTRAQLESAARNHAEGAAPRLAIGHRDPRFRTASGDGEPAIGRVENLRVEDVPGRGPILFGDYVDVPDWLDDAMGSAYPGRSLEGSARGDDLRISAVALLGVTRPGIHTLEDVRSFVEDGPALVAAGSDNQGHTFTVLLTAASPAPHAQEAATMDVDRTLLARRLGLADDATDEQIREALSAPIETTRQAEARTGPEARTPEAREARTEATVTELETRTVETPADPATIAAAAQETITRLSSEVADLRAREAAREAREAAREARETVERRDRIAASAVTERRITPGERDYHRRLLDIDEAGTVALIQSRAAGSACPGDPVSTAEEITAGAADDAAYKDYVKAHFGLEV